MSDSDDDDDLLKGPSFKLPTAAEKRNQTKVLKNKMSLIDDILQSEDDKAEKRLRIQEKAATLDDTMSAVDYKIVDRVIDDPATRRDRLRKQSAARAVLDSYAAGLWSHVGCRPCLSSTSSPLPPPSGGGKLDCVALLAEACRPYGSKSSAAPLTLVHRLSHCLSASCASPGGGGGATALLLNHVDFLSKIRSLDDGERSLLPEGLRGWFVDAACGGSLCSPGGAFLARGAARSCEAFLEVGVMQMDVGELVPDLVKYFGFRQGGAQGKEQEGEDDDDDDDDEEDESEMSILKPKNMSSVCTAGLHNFFSVWTCAFSSGAVKCSVGGGVNSLLSSSSSSSSSHSATTTNLSSSVISALAALGRLGLDEVLSSSAGLRNAWEKLLFAMLDAAVASAPGDPSLSSSRPRDLLHASPAPASLTSILSSISSSLHSACISLGCGPAGSTDEEDVDGALPLYQLARIVPFVDVATGAVQEFGAVVRVRLAADILLSFGIVDKDSSKGASESANSPLSTIESLKWTALSLCSAALRYLQENQEIKKNGCKFYAITGLSMTLLSGGMSLFQSTGVKSFAGIYRDAAEARRALGLVSQVRDACKELKHKIAVGYGNSLMSKSKELVSVVEVDCSVSCDQIAGLCKREKTQGSLASFIAETAGKAGDVDDD